MHAKFPFKLMIGFSHYQHNPSSFWELVKGYHIASENAYELPVFLEMNSWEVEARPFPKDSDLLLYSYYSRIREFEKEYSYLSHEIAARISIQIASVGVGVLGVVGIFAFITNAKIAFRGKKKWGKCVLVCRGEIAGLVVGEWSYCTFWYRVVRSEAQKDLEKPSF